MVTHHIVLPIDENGDTVLLVPETYDDLELSYVANRVTGFYSPSTEIDLTMIGRNGEILITKINDWWGTEYPRENQVEQFIAAFVNKEFVDQIISKNIIPYGYVSMTIDGQLRENIKQFGLFYTRFLEDQDAAQNPQYSHLIVLKG